MNSCCYQMRKDLRHCTMCKVIMARAFNKRVKLGNLKEGDFMLKEFWPFVFDPRGKFKPNWAEPYVIKTIMTRGAMKLMELDGEEMVRPVNLDRLCKYYT
jgi:hypothetical protein